MTSHSQAAHCKSADEVRQDLHDAFEKADVDCAGALNRSKLTDLVHDLHITLKDMTMDLDALLDTIDQAHTGQITYQVFAAFFDPFVREHEASGLEMEVDEIMKDAITRMLAAVREQRNHVNAGFLETSQKMEREHQGFGVNFWGSTWRFRLYDDLYSSPKTKTGEILRYSLRYGNLKARLAGIAKGNDPWIFATTAADERIRGEISNPAGVQKFCKEWLAHLERTERARERRDARDDVSG